MNIKNNLNLDQVYTASMNELIVVQMEARQSGARYNASIISLDNNDNETQIARGSVQWNQGSDAWTQFNTISAPVSTGQRYKVVSEVSDGVNAYYQAT